MNKDKLIDHLIGYIHYLEYSTVLSFTNFEEESLEEVKERMINEFMGDDNE